MLELFPSGFEEVDAADGVELVAYTDPGGEERLWFAFSGAKVADVPPGWERRWRDFHKPVRVDGVWIGPPWEPRPADGPSVVIDPGQAFGTGGHPTTRLALQLLGRAPRGSLLDIGCGSGVISIAGAKLGFGPVIAVDADPHAIDASRRNAEANGVIIDARVADALDAQLPDADVAVANVTLGVVEAIAPRVNVRRLVTSGYLVSDAPELPGFRHLDRVGEAGWAADAYVPDRQ